MKKIDNAAQKQPLFFNASKIGGSLKEVEVQTIPTEVENVTSRWFHAAEDADLFLWEDSKRNVIKQQVTFFGQVVEWNVLDGVKTGVIIEEELGTNKIPASEVIRYDRAPQQDAVRLAIEVLRHVRAIESGKRDELLRHFEKQESLSDLPPQEVIRRYGKPNPNSIWRRFQLFCQKLFS